MALNLLSPDLSVLDRIDWEALSQIYKLKNWRWGGQRGKSRSYIPTAAQLQECVLDLINGMDDMTRPISQCSTGRITVIRLDDVVRVWVGTLSVRAGWEHGFWAHRATEKLLEILPGANI
jgi:hypothetical protein